MKFFATLLTGALLVSPAAYAEPKEYAFDKAHTQILFFVNHLGYSNSQGEFLDYDGKILFDQAEPAKSSVEVTIQTSGIDMDDDKWNEHMKSADFFNVEKYPTMTFKSTGVEMTGDKTAKMTGDLTILDVTKPVTLDVTLNKADVHPMLKVNAVGFSAKGLLKRSDFGMNYGLPMVGDDVTLMIEVEAAEKTIVAPN